MTGDASRQVEGGELPEGWKWTSIGTHYAFKNGLNKAKRFFGQGTPIINYMDVYSNQRLSAADIQGKVTVTNDEADAYSAYQGDAFFTRTSETVSEIGYSAVLLEPVQRAVFSGFVLRGRPKNKELLPEFAAYALRARDVRKQIETRATYTTRALTNGGSLSECTFPLPPEPEQKRIAQALSDIDDLIASLDALIAKKRDIKQGAMQQLLTGRLRLPGFAGEWDEFRIGQIADPTRETNSHGEDLPVLTCSKHHGFMFSLGFFKNRVFSTDTSSYKIIRKGEIGYPSNHIEEGSIGLQEICEAGLVSPIYVTFRCLDGVDPYFLHRLLKTEKYTQEFSRATSSSVDRRGSLRWPEFSRIVIRMPPHTEQLAISAKLRDFELEIADLEKRIAKARTVRLGMMQQLLTGRIRLV